MRSNERKPSNQHDALCHLTAMSATKSRVVQLLRPPNDSKNLRKFREVLSSERMKGHPGTDTLRFHVSMELIYVARRLAWESDLIEGAAQGVCGMPSMETLSIDLDILLGYLLHVIFYGPVHVASSSL